MSCVIRKTIEGLEKAMNSAEGKALEAMQKYMEDLKQLAVEKGIKFSNLPAVGNNEHTAANKQILDLLQTVDTSKQTPENVAGGIWTMRNGKPIDFGNPFVTQKEYVKTDTDFYVGENNAATIAYFDWLMNDKLPEGYNGDIEKLTLRRKNILANLGMIRNAKALIYKGTARGKQLNHVTALQYIAENPPKNVDQGVSKTPLFDKLPSYVAGQKNMTYAGIGSRETPPEILAEMTKAAKMLESKGYTLQTGVKARYANGNIREEGADQAFSNGTTKKILFAPQDADNKVRFIAAEVHPNLQGMLQAVYHAWVGKVGETKAMEYAKDARDLQARNTYQVFGKNLDKPVDFVLFYAKETSNPLRPKGGTGQAVEMARRKGIPTINMAEKGWEQKLEAIVNAASSESENKTAEAKADAAIITTKEQQEASKLLEEANVDVAAVLKKIKEDTEGCA